MHHPSEPETRRSLLLLGADYVGFGVAMAFLGPTTILPALVRLLGGGPIVVGSLGTIQSGGWLLPQVLAGRWVANQPRVRRQILLPAYAGRFVLILAVPAVWWLASRSPGLALAGLLLGYISFVVGDALSSVGWIELLGKVVPLERRGRFVGAGQALVGLLGMIAGLVVRGILARPGSLVVSHLMLVSLAALFFMLGTTGTVLVREPPGAMQEERQPAWRDYLPRLAAILRRDRRFAWLVAVRWLAGLGDMAGTFYTPFASDRMRIPEQAIGLFVSAGVLGGLLSGVFLGYLSDRRGSARVIAAALALRCLCPTLALLAAAALPRASQLAVGTFFLIFTLAGMANGGYMIGFMNYILEIAPPHERGSYVALANTLGGLLLVAPLVAGWLVQVASYEVLFAITLGLGLCGLAMALFGPQRFVALRPAATSGANERPLA